MRVVRPRVTDRSKRSSSDEPRRRVAGHGHCAGARKEVVVIISEVDRLPSGHALTLQSETRVIRLVHVPGNRSAPGDVLHQRAVVAIREADTVERRNAREVPSGRAVTVGVRAAAGGHRRETALRGIVTRCDQVTIRTRNVANLLVEVVVGVRRSRLADVRRRIVPFQIRGSEIEHVSWAAGRREGGDVPVRVVADVDHA